MRNDLFADDARKIMRQASAEAGRLGHAHIGTGHILLGLLKEGSCVTPSMLNKLDHFSKVRAELETDLNSGERTISSKVCYAAEAQTVLELAAEEANSSGHPCVESEHILLGLVLEPDGIAGQVLKNFGLTADELRAEIKVILCQPHRIAEAKLANPSFADQSDSK